MSIIIFDSLTFSLHIYPEEIIQNVNKDEHTKMFPKPIYSVGKK